MNVLNKNNRVRLTIDFIQLKRKIFPIPPVEEMHANVKGTVIFNKLDANSGFYQVDLAEESKELTTFLMPFGRYYFNQLPFGIMCAPEYFQAQMKKILENCKNVVYHMDNILVWGSTIEEQNKCLAAILAQLKKTI